VSISRLLSLSTVSAIAHRGGSKLRPENTIAAFDHALALGVDGLECDVHLSSDGEPVVIHDPTLDRTTDATGPVSARTATALAAVDAGARFGAGDERPYRGAGLGVPRLAEVLDRYRQLPIVVEIKGDRPEVAERTLAVVREAGAAERVIFGGFSRVVLEVMRQHAPEMPTSASSDEAREAVTAGDGWRPASTRFRLFQVPLRLEGQQMFGPVFVTAARRAGLPVQAWIVDEADDMRRLIDWGVTGLISDRPDTAVEVIRATLHSPGG